MSLMLTVETRQAVNPEFAKTLDTEGLRKHFLASDMFRSGEVRLIYTHYDRFVMGGAVPNGAPLTLDKVEETKTPSFLDRREMSSRHPCSYHWRRAFWQRGPSRRRSGGI